MTATFSSGDILDAYKKGHKDAYKKGHKDGYKKGHKDGYAEGHADALQSVAQHNGDGLAPYQDGFLEIDFGRHEVKVQGVVRHLTRKQFSILAVLVRHPNQVLTCTDIQGYVWGEGCFSPKLASWHIKNLRAALVGQAARRTVPIITVRGHGYYYEPLPEPEFRPRNNTALRALGDRRQAQEASE